MKSWRTSFLLASSAALLIAIPALSQESEAPESLLPPGFGDPQTLPPPEEKAESTPRSQAPVGPARPSAAVEQSADLDEEELDPLEAPRPLNYFAIPEGTARPVDPVGILDPGNFGLGPNAFGRANGAFLASLMQHLDAPLPSRWTSILLRRALLSRVSAPATLDPVDWVAARADLLLRMGEADAARLLVQAVDQENYSANMVGVAAQTALATADPAALCPLVEPADSREASWTLTEAMCAALEGEPARAAALADEARRRGEAGTVDFLLAEKVIGAGAETRRAVTIDWEGVRDINPWRFGLASATGIEIPAPLLGRTSPHIQAWLARAPMVPIEQRLSAASMAASLGVFSSQSLVSLYSLMLDQTDPAEAAGTVGARLRTAWVGNSVADRLAAMRSLWQEPRSGYERHARLILTAGAAARIPPSVDQAEDAPNLIASMLTAGLDRRAARWSGVVDESGDARSWAMLAVGAPGATVDMDLEKIERFGQDDEGEGQRRSQMLIAALAGLGRLDPGQAAGLARSAGFELGLQDRWSRAIDNAARERAPGLVALLSAVGMQTSGWNGVPPAYLYRMLRGLRAVGLDYEARMIAAEAVARL